jgi:hypothetical protein
LPSPGPLPLDEAAKSAFKQHVIAALPIGSQGIETVSEVENSLMPGGNPSFELILTYKAMGKTFQRSALLVHCPTCRLYFRLTAEKQDFNFLALQFRRSIMSWQVIPEKLAVAQAGK